MGIALAVYFYGFNQAKLSDLKKQFANIYQFILNKWYFDDFYDLIFVKPAIRLGGFFWERGDRDTIDGFGPDGMSALVYRISGACSRIQTGFVFHYAFAMLIGVVVLVSWYLLRFKG